MVFGQGEHVYEIVEAWGKHFYSPYIEVVGIGVNSKDQVYVFTRGVYPVLIFDSEGKFLKAWGLDKFSWPHSLDIGPDDSVYCTDGDHTVRKFTPEGKLLMTLGKKNHHPETGCVDEGFPDYRTIKKSAGPFYKPTDTDIDKEDNIYVSDGYGNARIHKFSKDGELLLSWGEPGRGPGQFNIPHGVCVNDDIIYVADRENNRIQLFDSEGKLLEQWDANRPTDIFIRDNSLYVSELGFKAGVEDISSSPKDGILHARLSIFTLDGELLSRWGSEDGCVPGNFFAPHGLCVDSKNNIYVGEVVMSACAFLDFVPANCHTLQKFAKVRR